MIAALKKFFGTNGNGNGMRESKTVAKSRLSFVLVQDRTGLTQDEISNFKKEMVAVIEKYFVIDETGLDVSYKRETDSTMLIINSPVVVKRQEGFKHRVGARHLAKGTEAKTVEAKSIEKSEPGAASTSSESPISKQVVSTNIEAEKQAVGS